MLRADSILRSMIFFSTGGLYKDDCLIQPNIPIFIMVTGVAHLVIASILLLRILRNLFSVFLDTAIFAFMFCWLILGMYLICFLISVISIVSNIVYVIYRLQYNPLYLYNTWKLCKHYARMLHSK